MRDDFGYLRMESSGRDRPTTNPSWLFREGTPGGRAGKGYSSILWGKDRTPFYKRLQRTGKECSYQWGGAGAESLLGSKGSEKPKEILGRRRDDRRSLQTKAAMVSEHLAAHLSAPGS